MQIRKFSSQRLASGFLIAAFAGAMLLTQIASAQTIAINGSQEGRVYDGHGAVSAGASSRLLVDYPEPQRSQILDYLFKPNYGAALQHLKVEIGGDVNSTDGTEPSHMHSRTDTNYNRGYEWWLMKEAKARNPAIILDSLAWGAPGWIGNGNYWSQDMADYVVNFLKGAKQVHNLDIEFTGVRNEVVNNTNWIITLRNTLNAAGLANVKIVAGDEWSGGWTIINQLNQNVGVSNAVYAVGAHYRSHTDYDSPANAKTLSQKLWGSEEGIGGASWAKAQELAKLYNRNYIVGKITKNEIWSPITAYYDILAAAGSGLMVANTPWSGNYSVSPAIWATAHTTQFAFPGWKYLDGTGNGILAGGGSYVTLKSTNNSDYSIVIETTGAAATQNITFQLSGGLSTGQVRVWRTTSAQSFIQQASVSPVAGAVTISLEANAIYTLTTTTGQAKGTATPPPAAALALPYYDDFESYAVDGMARYLSDQSGVFEIVSRADGKGKAARQVTTQNGIQWATQFSPYTIMGEASWRDYEVSVDALLESTGSAYVFGRIVDIPGFSDPLPRGYWLKVSSSGTWQLVAASNVLASGTTSFPTNTWHRLRLTFQGKSIKAYDNGNLLADVQDTTYGAGMVGFGSDRHRAQFDEFFVGPRHRGLSNLGLSAVASASSVYQNDPTYNAAKANDGSESTRWNANAVNGSWLELNFGTPTVFNRTTISQFGDRITAYKIQAWNGTTWIDLVVSTNNMGSARTDFFGVTTNSRVRLFVTTATTTPSIYEFAVFNDTTNSNFALTATASASSFWQNSATFNAAKANDGSLSTRWNAHATNSVGCWVELDFGSPTAFNKSVLRQYDDRVTGYEIQYWTGASWGTAYTGGQLGGARIDSFPTVTGSKARFLVTAATNIPSIFEFEIYYDPISSPSVFINEWMTFNNGVVRDPKDNDAESWFELYNPGNQTVDLSGWFLSGTLANRFQYTVPAGFQLSPGGYLLAWADGETSQNTPFNGDLHTNFQLTNSSVIGLYSPSGEQIDLVDLVKGTSGKSYGSRLNGEGTVLETVYPTPRVSNSGIIARSITMNPTPSAKISFSGIPSATHRVLFSTNLSGTWWDLGVLLANPLGDFVFDDTTSSNRPASFYRATFP